MSTPLIVVALMRAQPGKEDVLRQALLALVDPTRTEDGCIQYDLHEENQQPGHFVFFERWTSKEALMLDAWMSCVRKPPAPDTGSLQGDLETAGGAVVLGPS